MSDGRGEARVRGVADGRGEARVRPQAGVRAHAVELVLDDAGEDAVRDSWAALEAGAVPSLARHSGTTHRPHVTVLSGPPPTEDALRLAATTFDALLPVELPVSGLGLLGRPGRSTLVELVVPPIALLEARARIAELWPASDARPWLAHLTLAQRLSPEMVASALSLLAGSSRADSPADSPSPGTGVRRGVGLRWWNPDLDRVLMLAGG